MILSATLKNRASRLLLLTALACPGAAFAAKNAGIKEPQHSFRPAAAWSVGPNASNQTCAMATEFNNGFRLMLASSGPRVGSLSVNVRQPAFQAGWPAAVTLTVPGVAEQSFPARAVNPEVVEIDLRGQDNIYGLLKESGVVDMNLAGNEFRFYLTGFAHAVTQFEQCTRAAAPQTVSSSAPPAFDMKWADDPAVAHLQAVSSQERQRRQEEPARIQQPQDIPPQDIYTRAPPPPTGSLSVPAPSESDAYNRELSLILPEEEEYKVPIQEIIPDENGVREISRPLAVSPRPPGRQRLTEMLAEEMMRQQEELDRQDNVSVDTHAEKVYALPPLKAPLVQKGSAAEKALADILMDAPPATEQPQPELKAEESGAAQKPPAGASAPRRVILNPDPEGRLQQLRPIPPKAEPVIHHQKTSIEVDVTGIGAPEAVPAPPKPEKNWLETREEGERAEKRAALKEAAKAAGRSAGEPLPQGAGDMAARIRMLEEQLATLSRENEELEQELKFALDQSKTETVAIASDNWNLEKASERYNEAKRQIDRMGQQIRKERAQCAAEKKELEAMLFDPQLTEQSQLARLAAMEDKLAEAERQLEEQRQLYEARIELLEGQGGAPR